MMKKGSVQDVALMMCVVFALGIAFLATHYILGQTINKLVLNEQANQSEGAVTAFNTVITMTGRLDYVIFGVFIGLTLGILITGLFVGGHPLFMILYFFLVCILTGLSAIISNVWEAFSNRADFITSLPAFPITNHLLTYFPIYIAVVGGLGIIAMFAKPYVFGGGINE